MQLPLFEETTSSQLLDDDPEINFVVALSTYVDDLFRIAFFNTALRDDDALYGKLQQKDQQAARFFAWIHGTAEQPRYDHASRDWTRFVLQNRWVVVRARPSSHDGTKRRGSPPGRRPNYSRRNSTLSGSSQDSTSLKPARGLIIGEEDAQTTDLASYSDVRLDSFHRMMQMSDVGVFEYHPSGGLRHANEAWYQLSGHPREIDAHQDFSFMDLIHPEDASLVMDHWNKLTQGQAVTFEMRWKASHPRFEDGPDADAQWVLSACIPVLDENGDVVSIAGNMVDISAQKRAAYQATQRSLALERARTSESRFSKLAQYAPIAIYILNSDRKVEYCNGHFFQLSGHPEVPYPEVDLQAIILAEDMHIIESSWKVLLEDKKPVTANVRLNRTWMSSDGVERAVWIQGASYPELNEHGVITYIYGNMADVSQFKLSESLQKDRVEETLEAKRQQETFIDMTSHEMRNPLSAFIQCAESTINSLMDILNNVCTLTADQHGEHNEALERIRREVQTALDAPQTIVSCSQHQKRIINDVLTLSKLDSKLLLITPVSVAPVNVITDAMKMFELECSKAKMLLKFQEDPSMREHNVHWIMLDPSRLLQVLINLLTNAIKFTQSRPTRAVTVTVGMSPEKPSTSHPWRDTTFISTRTPSNDLLDGQDWGVGRKMYLWVTVKDTGCGLTSKQQANLFTRFGQASPKTHVQYGGSGLGLWISRSLTELQQGEIGVKSEDGVGSTFAFFVSTRLARPPSSDPLSGAGGIRITESTRPLEDRIKEAHYSVLIVEDNVVNQKVLAKQLTKLGCKVHIADHGKDALAFLETTAHWRDLEQTGIPLHIILLDQEMPVMGGLECARRIRALQKEGQIVSHIPILGVSANARPEQVQEGYGAGMDDAITKPYRIPELLPKLERLARMGLRRRMSVDGG